MLLCSGFEYATLSYSLAESLSPHSVLSHSKSSSAVTREIDLPATLQRKQEQNVTNISVLKVTILAEDSGKELPPGLTWSSPFPVTVGTLFVVDRVTYTSVSQLLFAR